VQVLLEERSAAPLFGWKIAATSTAGQAHINVTGPLAGRLLAEKVIDLSRRPVPEGAKAELPFGVNHMKVAEAEFAFRMGRDLPPRASSYSVDDVLAAVDTLHPAIEIPDSRFNDYTQVGAAQLIADNACAHYFVLGAAAPLEWRAIDLAAHPVVGAIAGGVRREGIGSNVLGDQRIALAWLANELSGIGVTLAAGAVVTTGTCLVPLEIRPGDHVAMDFGPLGRVEVRLGDR